MTDHNDEPEGLSDNDRKRALLEEEIEQNWPRLLAGIRVYVWKFHLATDRDSIETHAREVLQDVVVTALEKSCNYSPDRPAQAWLLRVALNHVRHRLRAQASKHREILVGDSPIGRKRNQEASSTPLPEDELLDLLFQARNQPFRQGALTFEEMLSLVNDSDRKILRLVFVENLRGKALAAELRISEGAAYTRTSRAIAALRKVFLQGEQENNKAD